MFLTAARVRRLAQHAGRCRGHGSGQPPRLLITRGWSDPQGGTYVSAAEADRMIAVPGTPADPNASCHEVSDLLDKVTNLCARRDALRTTTQARRVDSRTVMETIRVCDGREEWLFDGEIGLTEIQIRELLSRTRPTDAYEPDVHHVAACCFEMFGKQVSIWRVPGSRARFSVARRVGPSIFAPTPR